VFTKLFNSSVKLNIILIISFSISVNSFTLFPNVNNAFYVLFHLTFIYLIFYHYHYYLYVVALVYGVLFDILLLNYVGTHLITFLSLLIFFVLLKKYLIRLSSYQIIFVYFITLIALLLFEQILANLINNYKFNLSLIFNFFLISLIIFFPTVFLFTKLDK
jgi:rod shape-determining protein MreD